MNISENRPSNAPTPPSSPADEPVARDRRTAGYKPGLAWFTAIGGAWVLALVMLGAFTTSINAGMIFPDWPLSNGSLNPVGWLHDAAMFAEHSHRLSAGLMSIITLAMAAWVWTAEARPWVRKLALGAAILIFVQAGVGGLRVLLDPQHLDLLNTSVGRLFAMAHAVLAQIFVSCLVVLALALGRPWIEGGAPAAPAAWRKLGVWCVGLLIAQLAIAAVMRHSFAGLAIPYFPQSTAEGGWLPPVWTFKVGIHFAHRVMAVVLTVALVALAIRVWRDGRAAGGAKRAAMMLVALLALQIALGAASVLSLRDERYTTAHVIVGASLLALTVGLTAWGFRFKPAPTIEDATTLEKKLSLRRA